MNKCFFFFSYFFLVLCVFVCVILPFLPVCVCWCHHVDALCVSFNLVFVSLGCSGGHLGLTSVVFFWLYFQVFRSCHDSWIRQQVSDRLTLFSSTFVFRARKKAGHHVDVFVEIVPHFGWIIEQSCPTTLLNVQSLWNCGFIIIRHRLHGLPGNILRLPLFLVTSLAKSYDNNSNMAVSHQCAFSHAFNNLNSPR